MLERDVEDSAMSDPVHQRDAHATFNVGQIADIERVDLEGLPNEPGAVGEAKGADAGFPPSMAGQSGGADDIGTSGEAMVNNIMGLLEAGSLMKSASVTPR